MDAIAIINSKIVFPDGFILQLRVWQLRHVTPDHPHGLKYSLFYGRAGERTVFYDNEVGKGDHRHYGQYEEPYIFVSLEQLLTDFESDVARERSGQ